MKKTLLALSLLFSGVILAETSTPAGWTDDYEEALRRATAENKLVLADFTGSDWCCWCIKLDEEVFSTEAFRKAAPEKYVLLMVDSPKDGGKLSEKAKKQNPALNRKYGISGYPTVLLLDGQGEVVFKTGYAQGGPEKYLAMLDQGVKDAPEVAKYIKPIEKVLNECDEDFRKALDGVHERVRAKFPRLPKDLPREERIEAAKKRQQYAMDLTFGEVAVKFVPLFEASFAKAKAMEVPEHLRQKKDTLITDQERHFEMLRQGLKNWQERQAKAKEEEAK